MTPTRTGSGAVLWLPALLILGFAGSALAQDDDDDGAADESATVEDRLRRAKNEYAYGNYERAIAKMRALLYPMRLYSDEQVITARRYLGLSYYLLDRQEEAREEFIKLLYLDPDYELDPFTVAPPIIELFEAVRKQHKPHLDAQRVRKTERQLEKKPMRGFRRTILVNTTERSDIATFLPFGVGQFQNGDVFMGLLFAVVEIAFLGLNIGSFLFLRSQQVFGRPAYPANKAELVQALTITQFASAGAFGIVWSLGVFHARFNFVPSTQRRTVTDEPVENTGSPGIQLELSF